jgi:hypothetical protein
MVWVILLVIIGAVLAYRFRVPLMAKVLGQSPERVQRRLERRKD